jgi:hypothetical protein
MCGLADAVSHGLSGRVGSVPGDWTPTAIFRFRTTQFEYSPVLSTSYNQIQITKR